MKIQIASDLHLEIAQRATSRNSRDFFRGCEDRDVLVLAGDIGRLHAGLEFHRAGTPRARRSSMCRATTSITAGRRANVIDQAWKHKAQAESPICTILIAEGVTH